MEPRPRSSSVPETSASSDQSQTSASRLCRRRTGIPHPPPLLPWRHKGKSRLRSEKRSPPANQEMKGSEGSRRSPSPEAPLRLSAASARPRISGSGSLGRRAQQSLLLRRIRPRFSTWFSSLPPLTLLSSFLGHFGQNSFSAHRTMPNAWQFANSRGANWLTESLFLPLGGELAPM